MSYLNQRYIPDRGDRFTMSWDAKTNEWAYTTSIWECVERNAYSVVGVWVAGLAASRGHRQLFNASIHRFYAVSAEMVRALDPSLEPREADPVPDLDSSAAAALKLIGERRTAAEHTPATEDGPAARSSQRGEGGR